MRVVQVLPELNSGGVERGTVEFARYLVAAGHESIVISAGGQLVPLLEQGGSRHCEFPVHRKSLWSLLQVAKLRRLLEQLNADVIHVRSRMPAWLVWLALGRRPRHQRPALVSTFHGLYSVNPYSAIMGCGDQVIAISECVRDYITSHYPKISPDKITLVHRGVDRSVFHGDGLPSSDWLAQFDREYPGVRQHPVILMPGRLSRWKGQLEFIELMARLRSEGKPCTGLIVGAVTPGKDEYHKELEAQVADQDLQDSVRFLGHRADMAELYSISDLVCNLSQRPEPFGRTVIEAMAMGTPVVAYDVGGPAESLRAGLPQGLVEPGNFEALVATTQQLLAQSPVPVLIDDFTLQTQAEKTVAVYHRLLAER